LIFQWIIIFGNGGWKRNVAIKMEWDTGGICLLRTGELLRWRRYAAEGMKLWVSNESHFCGYIGF
jgi:hypothetical protein